MKSLSGPTVANVLHVSGHRVLIGHILYGSKTWDDEEWVIATGYLCSGSLCVLCIVLICLYTALFAWIYDYIIIYIYICQFIYVSIFKQNHGINLCTSTKKGLFSAQRWGELFRGFLSAERLGTTLPSTLGLGYEMTWKIWNQVLIFLAFAWIFEKGLDKIRGWTVIISFCKLTDEQIIRQSSIIIQHVFYF